MFDGCDAVRTICSICYEDLKPIVEDLQSISICGHVFHELCLQQWFEYCLSAKKYTCPVCKQSCRASDVARLYFQSLGDVDESVPHEKAIGCGEDAGVLRREVKKLEVKVSGLSSTLERQGKELRELTDELCACKKQAKLEITLKDEALKQKTFMQRQLHMKSEELEKSTSECRRLQDRNMALAKELAAFKLVSDLDLDEEEISKLATLGNGTNSRDTIDTLRRSLVMRNRSYKELMAKCNLLGRGEARYCKKLEKAKEKINKLKTRVQELETAAELKENEILRSLKVSKKTSCSKNVKIGINSYSDLMSASKLSSKEQEKQFLTPKSTVDQFGNITNKSLQSLNVDDFKSTVNKDVTFSKESGATVSLDEEKDWISLDEEAPRFPNALAGFPKFNCKDQASDNVIMKPTLPLSEAVSGVKSDAAKQGECDLAVPLKIDIDNKMNNIPAGSLDDDVTLPNDVKEFESLINIRKENPSPSTFSSPGDICFSGGLLGPDGTHRYLGKWCKRGQNRESASAKGSSNGDLIVVGADGRGGRVKVLRSPRKSFLDGKENSTGSKRLKVGHKTGGLQSQGCFQLEHFFSKASH